MRQPSAPVRCADTHLKLLTACVLTDKNTSTNDCGGSLTEQEDKVCVSVCVCVCMCVCLCVSVCVSVSVPMLQLCTDE